MEIEVRDFYPVGFNQPALKLLLIGEAKGSDSEKLRTHLDGVLNSGFTTVYLDVTNIGENDLGFINEVIHFHYSLIESGKRLILLYRKGSSFETWIDTSGIDKFVELAMIP